MSVEREGRKPSFIEAIIAAIIITGTILISTVVFKVEPHIPMFLALVFSVLFAMYLKYPWGFIEKAIYDGIQIGLLPMLLMILVGMIIGSWIASGTVPYIIYLGIKIISPKWFLLTTLIGCSILSLCTGSSWTTIGTLGIALMGIGYGLGVPPAMTAAAIVSGAYFGDKQSPLSETTNFAPAVAGTTLFEHVNSMLYSTVPSFLLAGLLYTILGMNYVSGVADVEKINLITSTLKGSFNFTPILLLLPVILVIIIAKKVPALLGMGIAAILGFLFAVIFQGNTYTEIVKYMYYGYIGETGVDIVDKTLTKGGVISMWWTISLVFIALSMGGILERVGVLETILNKISSIIKSRFGLITTTLFSTLALEFLTADSYLPMLLVGRTFRPAYDAQHIDRKVLSRSLEDCGTLGAPMVPWGTNGVFIATTLGVATLSYLPYYFLGILTPIVSMVLAATGMGIFYTNRERIEKGEDLSSS